MGHVTIVKPFSDICYQGERRVLATLLHDPTVEGLDVALYMDGSASMEDEYGPRGILAKLAPIKNQVEPQMQWMLEYLANKDRDGVVRVCYWATGSGAELEMVGDLDGKQAKEYKFPGPRAYGKATGAIEGSGTICGELVWLTDLLTAFTLLDAYEGDDFIRILRRLRKQDGAEEWAWCYVLADPKLASAGTPVPHGDWLRWLAEMRED